MAENSVDRGPMNNPLDLIREFGKHDWMESGKAVEALVGIGAEAVEPLLGALSDQDGYVRAGAAEALGKIGDHRAFEPLLEAVQNEGEGWSSEGENCEARVQAALALGRLGDQTAVDTLVQVLDDALVNDITLSWYVIEALGELGDLTVIPRLKPLRRHRDIDVVKSARAAIKTIKKRAKQNDT